MSSEHARIDATMPMRARTQLGTPIDGHRFLLSRAGTAGLGEGLGRRFRVEDAPIVLCAVDEVRVLDAFLVFGRRFCMINVAGFEADFEHLEPGVHALCLCHVILSVVCLEHLRGNCDHE